MYAKDDNSLFYRLQQEKKKKKKAFQLVCMHVQERMQLP